MSISRKIILAVALLFLAGCRGDGTPPPAFVQADAANANVTLQIAGSSQPLSPPESAQLGVGDGVQVDASGRALLRFSDFLTVEVLRAGDLQVQELDIAEQSALAVFGQSGGAFVNDLTPGAGGIDRRVTVESDFALITATGTRFMVVKEANSPLEWLFGLDAGADDLTVQAKNDPRRAAPVIKPVIAGVARWIAPVGEPSAGVNYNVAAVEGWLAAVERGDPVPEVGEVLWPHANARMDTGRMTTNLQPGRTIDMGGVAVGVEAESVLGRARYAPMDCNGDAIDDIFVQNGIIRLDFRTLLSRVRGLDVTLMAGAQAANGSVTVLDPAVQPVKRVTFAIPPGEGEIISLRSEQPYHYAEIAIVDGCFLGFSLTPPGPVNRRSQPVSAVDLWPPAPPTPEATATPIPRATATPTPIVIRPTAAATAFRPGAELVATAARVEIDGSAADWQKILRQTALPAFSFDTIVFDQRCARRYPYADPDRADLAAQTLFAYDSDFLYVAFAVADEGFAGYTGSDQRFFLSDAPQLSLDLDLEGDANNSRVNGDDKQIDFRIGIKEVGDSPAIAFWDLGPGQAVSYLLDAPVAAIATESGYFLEAAIPWKALEMEPVAGLRLGMAASVSDNDTPDTTVQECMISSSAKRMWDNPTTWGVLILEGR